DQLGAVGRSSAVGVQAQPGLDSGDGAVGVDVPLLVRLAVAVPDDHGGTVGRTTTAGVQTLVAEQRELPAGGTRPTLVGVAVAVEQLHLSAVGGAGVGIVDAPAGLATD